MQLRKGINFFKVADFIGLFDFKWHGQNEVGNVGIIVLWTDGEKLNTNISKYKLECNHFWKYAV